MTPLWLLHWRAIMAFALASSAQLALLIDWDSDSSDKEDLVDYRTLPRSTRRSP
jgi:hypothetical protein